MNLTIGFIAFFILIIIPGFLFRRFYFFGEFSKQFNTKDPVLHSMFFSVIPGITIQLFGIFLYALIVGFEGDFLKHFLILQDFTDQTDPELRDETENFIKNDLFSFSIYSLCLFLLALLFGKLSSRFVRWREWDKKHKIFRFKNQWYYIFSGEVLKMRKFKEATSISIRNIESRNIADLPTEISDQANFEEKVSTTYADVLISNDQGLRELYTGYVVDYDLNIDDITKLDKIYLLDAYRYKKVQDVEADEMVTKAIKIPGDVFVLNAENVLNINLTYIPSQEKIERVELEKKRKERINILIRMSIVGLFISLHFIYKYFGLEESFFGEYIKSTSFVGKIISILFLSQAISLIPPYYFDREETNKSKYLIINGVIVLILGLLTYLFGFLRYLF